MVKICFSSRRKKDYLKAAREYYSKIEIPKDAFQKVINRIFPPITCKLTEEQLKKLAFLEWDIADKDHLCKTGYFIREAVKNFVSMGKNLF